MANGEHGEPNLQLRFWRIRQCRTHAVFVVYFVAIVVDVTVTIDIRGIVIVVTGRTEPPVKALSTLSLSIIVQAFCVDRNGCLALGAGKMSAI